MIRSKVFKWLLFAFVATVLICSYYLTPLSEYLTIEAVIQLTSEVPENLTTAVIFLGVFFVGGMLFIPIPLIAFSVSLVFGVWNSIYIVLLGLILASLSGYTLGKIIDEDSFGSSIKKHIGKIRNNIEDKGFYAVMALRLAPTPPFTITSILAGTININLKRYLIGSVLGIVPLALSAVLFGEAALNFIKQPSCLAMMTFIAATILLILYKLLKKKDPQEA